MLEFLCYFMPSFLSLKICEHLNKNELSVKDNIIYYGIFALLNNLLTLAVICLKRYKEVLNFDRIGISYCFKYLAISFVFSIVTPFIVTIIKKNISLGVEVKKNEKAKKRH